MHELQALSRNRIENPGSDARTSCGRICSVRGLQGLRVSRHAPRGASSRRSPGAPAEDFSGIWVYIHTYIHTYRHMYLCIYTNVNKEL